MEEQPRVQLAAEAPGQGAGSVQQRSEQHLHHEAAPQKRTGTHHGHTGRHDPARCHSGRGDLHPGHQGHGPGRGFVNVIDIVIDAIVDHDHDHALVDGWHCCDGAGWHREQPQPGGAIPGTNEIESKTPASESILVLGRHQGVRERSSDGPQIAAGNAKPILRADPKKDGRRRSIGVNNGSRHRGEHRRSSDHSPPTQHVGVQCRSFIAGQQRNEPVRSARAQVEEQTNEKTMDPKEHGNEPNQANTGGALAPRSNEEGQRVVWFGYETGHRNIQYRTRDRDLSVQRFLQCHRKCNNRSSRIFDGSERIVHH
mmetsp:Transcript_21472/g.59675  ORF Transcript_21472/g.59675 Transcript_21472/m.59675 type:complete len:312 (+) Transcript_21472:421-1356(+)